MSCLFGSGSALAYTGAKWNLPEGVTEMSHEVHHLHMFVFWICVVIGIVVFGAMFYSVFAHRKSKGAVAASFHESTLVEIIWTAIPFVILIGMAIPAAATLVKMDDTHNADINIKITGYQWKWQYEYLGEDVSYFSTLAAESNRARQLNSGIDVYTVPNYLVDVDHPLVLPVGKKIRFLITSNDVIHAWWVPAFAVKKDAIPGYINEVWTKIDEPGTFRGVCAELCGRDHGFMPIVVKALPEDEFKAWLAEQKSKGTEVASAAPVAAAPVPAAVAVAAAAPAATEVAAAAPAAAAPAAAGKSKDELLAAGEKVYKTNCIACHQAGGTGMPPTFPPLAGSKVVNGPKDAVIQQVLHGKNMMPPFPQLSNDDIAAVTSYVHSSWGNKGEIVQAGDVAAARK
ncbi:cytochrome c oxidase subunit II [Hydrocarboniphaga sp.]|uniref:cytochrome c oxidase subunit II n=1 Tax=Hydrocarboniphaga sp. TaxID=2033016 RepID=UPI002605E06C|nr:cytochrome c oxidase subunit II [Hydrocarboniphaga sp.]